METILCPKCGQTIASTEETCPACKVVIKDFLKLADDVDAANRYLATKIPKLTPQTSPTASQSRKHSGLRSLSTLMKGK